MADADVAIRFKLVGLDRRLGKHVGGARLREPGNRIGIHRWAIALEVEAPSR